MRIKPCIERRRWGVIGWLLLSRVGFAQRETKKPPIRRFFCISRKSGSGTSHLANGLKLLTFGEAYRQELALNSGRAASQTAGFRLVLSCKQWLWSMLGSLHRKLTIELGLMLCLVHRYKRRRWSSKSKPRYWYHWTAPGSGSKISISRSFSIRAYRLIAIKTKPATSPFKG